MRKSRIFIILKSMQVGDFRASVDAVITKAEKLLKRREVMRQQLEEMLENIEDNLMKTIEVMGKYQIPRASKDAAITKAEEMLKRVEAMREQLKEMSEKIEENLM